MLIYFHNQSNWGKMLLPSPAKGFCPSLTRLGMKPTVTPVHRDTLNWELHCRKEANAEKPEVFLPGLKLVYLVYKWGLMYVH